MEIVHLYDGHERVYDGRGSVPSVVWNVAREAAAAGHDVTVLERRWAGLPQTALHDGVRFERVALPTGADEPWSRVPYEQATSPVGLARLIVDRTAFAIAAIRRLRRLDPDVVHAHLPFAATVIATVVPWIRRRLVYTAHLGELRLNALDVETVGRGVGTPDVLTLFSPDVYLAKRAARTTVLNPAIRSAFIDAGVSADCVRVVPNGVDLDRFGRVGAAHLDRVRDRYGIGRGPVVLFVGTVLPRKGVAELIEALGRASEDLSTPPRAIIAGDRDLDPGYVADVERRIAEAGLARHVTMPGFVADEDLPALYAAADLFVMPSLEEGFGMTVVEAMAAGTPVIASRAGDMPRILEEGACGRLVDVGDVDELAAALRELLAAPERRAALADRARERAADFAWSEIGGRFVDLYGEVAP